MKTPRFPVNYKIDICFQMSMYQIQNSNQEL